MDNLINEAHACVLRIKEFAESSTEKAQLEISNLTSVLEANFEGITLDVLNWNAESWALIISAPNTVNKNVFLSKDKWSL